MQSLDEDIRKALLILTAIGHSEEQKAQVPRMLAQRTVRRGAPHRIHDEHTIACAQRNAPHRADVTVLSPPSQAPQRKEFLVKMAAHMAGKYGLDEQSKLIVVQCFQTRTVGRPRHAPTLAAARTPP